ncbi:hypothetical protein JCM3765_002511 [Sporobolomyces pararoseus]
MSILYEQTSPSSLIPLLRQHLPHSLPTYSTLQTPGKPLKVYSTFPPTDKGSAEVPIAEPWVVLIDAGNQFRFYCSQSSRQTTTSQDSTRQSNVDASRGQGRADVPTKACTETEKEQLREALDNWRSSTNCREEWIGTPEVMIISNTSIDDLVSNASTIRAVELHENGKINLTLLKERVHFWVHYEVEEEFSAVIGGWVKEVEETGGEGLLQKVVEEVMSRASREKREFVRIGAVPDRWTRVVEKVTGIECISASRIWCDSSWYSSGAASTTTSEEDLSIPEGFEFRDAREEDIPVILSTSEVPHLPSYLSTRLSHTSCLFSLRPPPSSSSSSPTSSSSSELVAHVTTHRDGSLGTLYVNPSYRRLGLARLVLRHRLSKMRQETEEKVGYCYVHRENEASRAVMKSLGWRESEGDVSWDIVNVKEWESRRELRN